MMMVLAVALAGCGTIFSGTTQRVNLVGVPQDADAFVDGANIGQQRQVVLKRNKMHTVTVQKAGCRESAAPIDQNFNGVAILNMFCLPCWLVDAVTGGVWDLEDQVMVPPNDCRVRPAPTPGQAMMSPVPPSAWPQPPAPAAPAPDVE
jgi:hypothetical protein